MKYECFGFQDYIIGLHRIDVPNFFRNIFRETDIKYRDEANPDPTQKKKNEQEGKSGKKVQKLIVLSNCLLIHLRLGTSVVDYGLLVVRGIIFDSLQIVDVMKTCNSQLGSAVINLVMFNISMFQPESFVRSWQWNNAWYLAQERPIYPMGFKEAVLDRGLPLRY